MPPALPADQELDLKRRARRRLIGAVALVLLMVLVLPRLLEHQPKTIGTEIPIRIGEASATASDSASETVTTNADSDTALSTETDDDASPSEPQPSAAPASAERPRRSEAAPTESAPNSTAAARSEPQSTGEASREGNFVVQVGAFSNAEKARRVHDKLAAAAIPAFTEKVEVSGETRIRVRAGPFVARRQAEAVLPKLKDLGLDGRVIQR